MKNIDRDMGLYIYDMGLTYFQVLFYNWYSRFTLKAYEAVIIKETPQLMIYEFGKEPALGSAHHVCTIIFYFTYIIIS